MKRYSPLRQTYAQLFEEQFEAVCELVAVGKGITQTRALFELVREMVRVKENMDEKNGQAAEARFKATGIEVLVWLAVC